MINSFITINKFSEFKYKVKGSVFIGQAFPAESKKEINEHLEKVKKKFFDASHYCYAFRLIENNDGYSDAGEPNGTAGIRIYNSIGHFDLSNILVVVTRYFGGTKLGIGPLGKAYYQTSFSLLEQSEKIIKKPFKKVTVETDYQQVNNILRIFSIADARILNSSYKEKVILQCYINYNDYNLLEEKIKLSSNGEAIFKDENEIIYL